MFNNIRNVIAILTIQSICLSRIHICVTIPTTKPGVADEFINDVKLTVAKVMENPSAAKATGAVSINGLVVSL